MALFRDLAFFKTIGESGFWEELSSICIYGLSVAEAIVAFNLPAGSRNSLPKLLSKIGELFYDEAVTPFICKAADGSQKSIHFPDLMPVVSEFLNLVLIKEPSTKTTRFICEEKNPKSYYAFIAYQAYYLYKVSLSLEERSRNNRFDFKSDDVIKKIVGLAVCPLLYAGSDRNFTFAKESPDGSVRINVKYSPNSAPWPALPLLKSAACDIRTLIAVIVLAIGWDKIIDIRKKKKSVWNGELLRLSSYDPILEPDSDNATATLFLERTSYVAHLGSNYGLIHDGPDNPILSPFFDRSEREELVQRIKGVADQDAGFRDLFPGEVNLEAHRAEIFLVCDYLRTPEFWELRAQKTILEAIKQERDNPSVVSRNSILANALSVNVTVYSTNEVLHPQKMIIQRRGKMTGHGDFPLQISAAGFVSKYIDIKRIGNEPRTADAINSAINECNQELGSRFSNFECHGLFRDMTNYEVGLALSSKTDIDEKAETLNLMDANPNVNSQSRILSVIQPCQEQNVEVQGYIISDATPAAIFDVIFEVARELAKSSQKPLKSAWEAMMPMGAASLVAWLASASGIGWDGLQKEWKRTIRRYKDAGM